MNGTIKGDLKGNILNAMPFLKRQVQGINLICFSMNVNPEEKMNLFFYEA